MKIKYEVTVEDLEDYSVFFMVSNKFGRRQYVYGRFFMGAVPFILLFLFGMDTYYDIWFSPMYLGGAALLSVGLVLAFSWRMKWGMKGLVRRMYAGDYRKGLIGWHERVLTDAGIEAATEVAKSSTSWEGIKGVQFAERYTYIWLGPNQAWVIPKERVTEGDYDAFAGELKRLFEQNRPGMKVETLA